MDIDRLFDIGGKTALVTGASSGIGYMIAEGLLRAGASVTICSRKAHDIAAAAQQLSAFGQVCGIAADVATDEGVRAICESVNAAGPLHILVNNAGTTWGAPLEHFPRRGFEKVLALNLLGPFEMVKGLLPALRAAATREDPARVVNIASTEGMNVPDVESYPYSASKAGLIHLGRHMGKFLAHDDITVNTIAPGPFPTKMIGTVVDLDNPDAVAAIASPLGQRIGTPEDVVGGILYLTSRAGAWLSGVTLPIAGGRGAINI